jgi:hypothetical protein
MAALATRKFSLFRKATSRNLYSTLQDSSCSLDYSTRHHSASYTTSWRHHPVKPGQEGSEPRLRRSSAGDILFPGNQDGLPRDTLWVPLNHDSIIHTNSEE